MICPRWGVAAAVWAKLSLIPPALRRGIEISNSSERIARVMGPPFKRIGASCDRR
jgi:hypothetical protein